MVIDQKKEGESNETQYLNLIYAIQINLTLSIKYIYIVIYTPQKDVQPPQTSTKKNLIK